jgi:hypothetical protein
MAVAQVLIGGERKLLCEYSHSSFSGRDLVLVASFVGTGLAAPKARRSSQGRARERGHVEDGKARGQE